MDYESSSKFISSLAKFLQSLCNGYVEFDNGVQVIGHLYLSVDTGKTIDYILNEKVCKTDENSVTFISNSFHAQPAEKPKPPGKRVAKEFDKAESKIEEDSDNFSGTQTELRSTNVGTVPTSRSVNQNSPHSQGSKRPYSPSNKQSHVKSERTSPKHKKSRTEIIEQNVSQLSNPASENSISSAPSPVGDGGFSHAAQSSEAPHGSQLDEPYQQSFFHQDDNSQADESEERDIKPTIDTDVTFIKEEFAPSSCSQSGNQSQDRNDSLYPYQSNPVFPGSYPGSVSFGASHRSNFSSSGSSHMFNSVQAAKSDEGPGDPSGHTHLDTERNRCRASTSLQASEMLGLNSHAENIVLPWGQRRMSYPPSSLLSAVGSASSILFPENSDATTSFPPSSPSSYRRMSRDVYGNPMFSTCSKCGGKYTNPSVCASHEAICNGTNRLKCDICQRVYSQMCALKEHLRGKHGLGNMLTCKLCGRSFKYKPQLYDHSCTGVSPKGKRLPASCDSQIFSTGGQPNESPKRVTKSELTSGYIIPADLLQEVPSEANSFQQK